MISTFALDEPQVANGVARIAWRVDPPASCVRGNAIELRFPSSVDLECVPRGILWIAALALLHPLWILLRPCRVRLPITLSAGEAEFWQRLIDAEIATLEAYRGTSFIERCISFAFDGPPLEAPEALPDRRRCAAAFSSGKDSLLQAAMLCEFGFAPTLVATTSPLPPLRDHVSKRRAYVLREVTPRLDVPLVQIHSDARELWENGYAARLGYNLAVSEMTDTHLYFASLLLAAASRGETHIFLASEADVQTNAIRDGAFVQTPHAMYSVATQASVSALLAPWNITYSSLTSPIFNAQVQRLLWTRYENVADLQYSCWRLGDDETACNVCSQCLRTVVGILAAHADPRRAGFDPDIALAHAAAWFPKEGGGADALPEVRSRAHLSAQMIDTVRSIDLTFAHEILGDRGAQALEDFAQRLRSEPIRPIRTRPAFGAFLDPMVREPALRLYAQAFSGEAEQDDAQTAARTLAAIRYITEPLAQ